MVYSDLFDKLNIEYYINHSMKSHTSLKVGGRAKIYVIPKTYKELLHAVEIFNLNKIKYKVLGNGSNVLISDKGYNGAIISTKKLNFISFNENVVTASCGTSLSLLINKCKDLGFSGLEKLYGIPATLGGAITMNAGAFGQVISDKLVSVCVIKKGNILYYDKNQCAFSYRKSRFQSSKDIILSATFSLLKSTKTDINKTIRDCQLKRKTTQPKSRSCGSVFKNSSLAPSALLIEKCGLKGFTLNNANVSNIHANFINVKEGCTAQDIYNLILTVKKKVKEKFNVTLEEEVEFLGEF